MDKKIQDTEAEDDIVSTGEDTPNEIELEEQEENTQLKIKKIRKQLKESESEKMQLLEDFQRAKADFLNTKKRLDEKVIRDNERILNNFLSSLLPLCDSFDMATADSDAWTAVDENWRKGVEGIKSQLDTILKQHNVVVIGEVNEPFDPVRHEAMSTIDNDDGESETVAEVLQKGYKRGETIIRPAKVIIRN